ncbi:MAG: hemerythrin domain-containing protein, partial [Polymorphobacter sp.]
MIPAEPRSCAAPDMPLGHFYAAHRRQRRLCLALAAATQAPHPSARALCALAIELVEDLQCLEAAEKLLFDLLRRRAEPEDDFARVLGILTNDHEAGRALAVELAAVLRGASAPL